MSKSKEGEEEAGTTMTMKEAEAIKDPEARKAAVAYLIRLSHEKDLPGWDAFKKQKRGRQKMMEDKDGARWSGELEEAVGRKVEIYSARAPRVEGRVVRVDERWAKVILKTERQTVSVSLGSIVQVRMDD